MNQSGFLCGAFWVSSAKEKSGLRSFHADEIPLIVNGLYAGQSVSNGSALSWREDQSVTRLMVT